MTEGGNAVALESSIVKSIMIALKKLGVENVQVEKTHGGQYGTAGRADLYILVRANYQSYPVPLYAECKQVGKTSTPLQLAWARRKRAVGAVVIEASSVEDVTSVVEAIGNGTYKFEDVVQ